MVVVVVVVVVQLKHTAPPEMENVAQVTVKLKGETKIVRMKGSALASILRKQCRHLVRIV